MPDLHFSNPLTILVVDDEPCICEFLVLALSREGFAVCKADCCAAAAKVLRHRPGEIDAALIDLRMPGQSGLETLATLRRLKPTLPCCLMGGDLGGLRIEEVGVDALLHKPFSVGEATASSDPLAP